MRDVPIDGQVLGVTTAIGDAAPAALVRDEADLNRAVQLLGLRTGPTVLLVGGAGNVDAAHARHLGPFFEEVVVPAVARLGAAVVTGGTDAGIMRLVGAASVAASAPIDLVGVAPYARVRAPGSRGHTPLARGHRAFVLTTGDAWGDESAVLHALARRLGGARPPVLLVNGGPVAMAEVDRTMAGGSPLVVVAGSGRGADQLAAAASAGPDGDRGEHRAPSTVIHLDDGVETLLAALRDALRDHEPTATRQ